MPNTPDFIDHLLDLMRVGGRTIAARRMFGGHGLYADGLFVGIVADDALYLRVDEGNRAAFEALGCVPFEYRRKDGIGRAMSYLRAPDDALESAHAMAPWARSALGAALRASAKPEVRGKKHPAKAGGAERAN